MKKESNVRITAKQIDEIQKAFISALRKSKLQSEPVQQIIGPQGSTVLAEELAAVVERRVKMLKGMFVRHVSVNRNRTPGKVLNAVVLQEQQHIGDPDVITSMLRGKSGKTEVDVFFFKVDHDDDGRDDFVDSEELKKEYSLRGLSPADPYVLAAVNEADSSFTYQHPNITYWEDSDDRKRCYMHFNHEDNRLHVTVDRDEHETSFSNSYWFAGVLIDSV